MNHHRARFASIAIVPFLVTGCATLDAVHVGQTTQAEVRRHMGIPTDIRFQPNGDDVWEYARGPAGRLTYVITFDQNGIVQEAKQVLTADTIARIKPEVTTKPQVRSLLGQPTDVDFLSSGEVWSYNAEESPYLAYVLAACRTLCRGAAKVGIAV
jgi:outer membrane protein assembly factor BamE (lipoprotein component of BamABCDE complex)